MEHKPYGPYEAYIKRPLDFCLSFGAFIVLSPVMGVTAVLVKTKLGSPVLFKQRRPGKDEKIFEIYKFRTMTDETDKDGNLLSDEDRLTGFGKLLRSTSLDELPELLNIIKGDMAVVGPRPLLTRYLPYYSQNERNRHSVRPGLTGNAQINGRNNLPWDDRLKLDVDYVNRITFLNDFNIVIKTIRKVLVHADVVDAGTFVMPDLDKEREKSGNNSD